MTNNKQQPPQENPNNQFSNNEHMTFAQKVEYVKSTEMTNNKQQTAVEWFHQKTWALKIQLEKGEISIGEYANTYATLYEQAKEMQKKQIIKAAQDNFYVGQDLANGCDIEWNSAEDYYNETYGGGEQ